jgi:hypothetical protein
MLDQESFCVKEATIYIEKGAMSKSKEIDDLADSVGISKVPESFFGSNKIRIETPSFTLTFGASESLQCLKHKSLESLLEKNSEKTQPCLNEFYKNVPFVFESDIKVPKADDWKKSRGLHEHNNIVEQQLDQDWTYLNHYRGQITIGDKSRLEISENNLGIPKDRLSVDNKILFYKDLFLYEDDLGDFGYSQLRIRLRAQSDSIFVLMRSYARVDNQQIRAIENRVFIDLSDYSIHREIDFLDGKYEEIVQNGFTFDSGFNVDFDQADKVSRFLRKEARKCDIVVVKDI